MIRLSDEQMAIIAAPLESMSVVACAGSGKTRTAVYRLAEIRKRLGNHRGRVALLSFSNVAVETFRQNFQLLVKDFPEGTGRDRVEIDTLDGFITSNVLRPHAHRTMVAAQAAFLVTGGESFLSGFTFRQSTYPVEIVKMQVGMRKDVVYFYCANKGQVAEIDTAYASEIVHRLGRSGAYTHNLGRYWCYRVLREQPAVLRALARRYPHVLIDEAQDISTLHQAILEQLTNAGTKVSLIGDPHQGIYDFAGANGIFLTQYRQRPGIASFGLTRNYRSVPAILTLANNLSARTDDAGREAPETSHGAFFVSYKKAESEQLVMAFQAAVLAADLKIESSAVLCRGREQADKLSGNTPPAGQGVVKGLAQAAILRDKRKDYLGAFKSVATSIIGLLKDPPQNLAARITQPARYPEDKPLRRAIWSFTRNPLTGLPAATLPADAQWHPQLVVKTRALLLLLKQKFALATADNLGHKLAKKKLSNAPLMLSSDLATAQKSRIRVETVHRVKGESLDAVLYLATKEHVCALLAGVDTEVGRIGYVAVTRARNLLWVGVPANALAELRPDLLARGFQEAGGAVAKPR